jgi:SAM-dependent methyltransferase
MMSIDEAVRHMRSQPRYAELVCDAYLGPDVLDSARRFATSGEFAEVKRLIGDALPRAVIVDLGAGTGIASWAFATAGAGRVVAVEPDLSSEVGQGAIRRLSGGLPIEIVSAFGERIPLANATADVVYARQVLHHTRDLPQVARECARILRPGGVFLACREHVVDDDAQLSAFLAAHPMHQLAGGENAYSLAQYVDAVRAAGLALSATIGPWDSVINAFPAVRSQAELQSLPRRRLEERFGVAGAIASAIPSVKRLVWSRITRPVPGRMYTLVARKP